MIQTKENLKINVSKSNLDLFKSTIKKLHSKVKIKLIIRDEMENIHIKEYNNELYFYVLKKTSKYFNRYTNSYDGGNIKSIKYLIIPNIFKFPNNCYLEINPKYIFDYLNNLDNDNIKFNFYLSDNNIVDKLIITDNNVEIVGNGVTSNIDDFNIFNYIKSRKLICDFSFDDNFLSKINNYLKNSAELLISDKIAYLKDSNWKLKLSDNINYENINFNIDKECFTSLSDNKINIFFNEIDNSYFASFKSNNNIEKIFILK